MKKAILFLLLPLRFFSQSDKVAFIDSLMRAEIAVNHFNGNLLVAESGKIIYQKAFGYRNYDSRELLDNNSVFELASVSKQFTAVGILMLKEQGKLKLSDSLRKYFPQLPYNYITIKNLLTHTSGLPGYEEEMITKWDHKNIASNSDVINFLAKEKPPVHFSPGKKWEYSNTGYVLLASIIEKVSGQTFKDYMSNKIFKPLGMEHSRVYNTRRSTKEIIPNYAYGFVYSDSLKKYMLPDSLPDYDFVIYLDSIVGDGIVNATTGDLLKWDRALKNYTLISESLQKEMFTEHSLMDTANKIYYGYGEMIGKNQLGNYITHEGGWPGYATIIIRFLAGDFTIIVLSNNETGGSGICNSIAAILLNKQIRMPYLHKEVVIDTNILNKYVGTYKDSIITLNIIRKSGKLYRHRKDRPDMELKAESNSKFFYSNGDRQVEFEFNKSGKVTKACFIYDGLTAELKKID
jgi:CubicO group peptidase (beta-lactamase class C family)